MCGISGFIGRIDDGDDLLSRQLGLIHHRGPDGEGRFAVDALHMGMRRLSIIDLAHGWQPLYSRNRRVVAFQNGEIYNYRDLQTRLEALGYRFQTQSDTEVLAHGYDAWGIDGLLSRVDGMFAMAIADLDTKVLHLARDPFGEKPLYFSYAPNRFVYGSSLRSISLAPWLDVAVDPVGVERYLACHFVPGRRTILQDVDRVLPGERLEIDFAAASPPRLKRYYMPTFVPHRSADVAEIEALLSEAVETRLIADVPVGLFLSGGIDSSLIAALAARRHSDIQTFCIGFGDAAVDESDHARAVADHLGLKFTKFDFDASRFMELMPQVAAALDEPIGDQALLPLFWLAKEASRSVKVVLSGEGADEIFGGYGYYACHATGGSLPFARAYATAQDERGAWPGLLVEARGETQSGFPLLTFRHEREALVPEATGHAGSFETDLKAWLSTARDPFQRAGAADLASWLPDDLLVKSDRMTMAASIEGRAPFLSRKVVQRALSLPIHQKYAGNESKVILRRLARKLLPSSVVDRRKQGFVLPMDQWVIDWFEAHGGFSEYIKNAEDLAIDTPTLISLYGNKNNHSRSRLWFALIALIEWWQSFKSNGGSASFATSDLAGRSQTWA